MEKEDVQLRAPNFLLPISTARNLMGTNNLYRIFIITAVPIEAFRKMLISSFPRLEELLHGVPQHFKEVPQKSHNFLSRLANHINFFKTTDQSR